MPEDVALHGAEVGFNGCNPVSSGTVRGRSPGGGVVSPADRAKPVSVRRRQPLLTPYGPYDPYELKS